MKDVVRNFIQNGGNFEACALELYAWQRQTNPEYDRFCGDVTVRSWTDIPAVPTALFQDVALTSFPPSDARVVFHTSGTTGSRPGVVRLKSTEIYDLSARLHAERCLGQIPRHGVSLVPNTQHSSLGHMVENFVPGIRSFFHPTEGIDVHGAWGAIANAAERGEPIFIPGTAFAFADLLDTDSTPLSLPPGSIVMVTGGFKGRRKAVPAHVLYSNLERYFPGASVVGEYGMSELASQLWAIPASGTFRPPPWLRILAVDPWLGRPATRGLLRFFDLANHQTVMAIETQDIGTVHPDGTVQLEGRLAGARLRGCSLSVENANG